MATHDVDKRPNYFDGQFLQDMDFRAEQDYYLDRQRRSSRLLFVSGIAEGLTVEPISIGASATALKLTVSEGTAIDPLGRQLILKSNTAIAPKPTDGTWFLSLRYDQKLTDPQEGTEIGTRWQETPLLELLNAESQVGITLAKIVIQNNVVSAFDLSVRQYSGIYLPSAKAGASLRSDGESSERSAVLNGNLSITDKLKVSGTLSANQGTFTAIGIGISNLTNAMKKLQIEQGELSIQASHNLETADIAAFYRADKTLGLGIGATRIEAIGTAPDQSIELRPKGSGQVTATQTLSVQKAAIAEAIDDAHLDINASGEQLSDYAKLRFRRGQLNGWLGYHSAADAAIGEFVLWDSPQKQPARLRVGDLIVNHVLNARSIQSNGAIASPMWTVTQLFNNQRGALPLRSTPFATKGGSLLVLVSGSGFSPRDAKAIGTSLDINGTAIGSSQVDAITANERYTFVNNAIWIPKLPIRNDNVLTLSALNPDTSTNVRDIFNVTIIEFPF
jgi:hypothetical protein